VAQIDTRSIDSAQLAASSASRMASRVVTSSSSSDQTVRVRPLVSTGEGGWLARVRIAKALSCDTHHQVGVRHRISAATSLEADPRERSPASSSVVFQRTLSRPARHCMRAAVPSRGRCPLTILRRTPTLPGVVGELPRAVKVRADHYGALHKTAGLDCSYTYVQQ